MNGNNTPEVALRIRLIAVPDPSLFDEYDLRRFRVGETYEVPIRLASLLILSGYAESAAAPLTAEAADFGAPRIPRPRSKP